MCPSSLIKFLEEDLIKDTRNMGSSRKEGDAAILINEVIKEA